MVSSEAVAVGRTSHIWDIVARFDPGCCTPGYYSAEHSTRVLAAVTVGLIQTYMYHVSASILFYLLLWSKK